MCHIIFKTNSESALINIAVYAASVITETESDEGITCSVESPLSGRLPWLTDDIPPGVRTVKRLAKMSGFYTGKNIIDSVADSVIGWGGLPKGVRYKPIEEGFIDPAPPKQTLKTPYCLIETSSDRHFSARLLSKDNYKNIADCATRVGLTPVFVGMSNSSHYIERHPDNGIDMVGKTTLKELAVLIKGAAMTVFQPSVPALLGVVVKGGKDRNDIVYCTGGDNKHWLNCAGRKIVTASCSLDRCGKRMAIPFGDRVTESYGGVCLYTSGVGDDTHTDCTNALTDKIITTMEVAE